MTTSGTRHLDSVRVAELMRCEPSAHPRRGRSALQLRPSPSDPFRAHLARVSRIQDLARNAATTHGVARWAARDPLRRHRSSDRQRTPGATEASALYGTPDRIAAELEALRAVGVQHVLLHGEESARQSVRRFSTEIMPAFTRPY